MPSRMPAWFRRGVRWLLHPEQCVQCGAVLPSTNSRNVLARRRQFEAFCSMGCIEDWDQNVGDY